MGGIGLPLTVTWVVWLVFASAFMVKAPMVGRLLIVSEGPKYSVVDQEEEAKSEMRPSNDTFSIGE
jgi:hypothetical protein